MLEQVGKAVLASAQVVQQHLDAMFHELHLLKASGKPVPSAAAPHARAGIKAARWLQHVSAWSRSSRHVLQAEGCMSAEDAKQDEHDAEHADASMAAAEGSGQHAPELEG